MVMMLFLVVLCLDRVTLESLKYPIKAQAEVNIRSSYTLNGKDTKHLSKLPAFAGGHTDFMIGVK